MITVKVRNYYTADLLYCCNKSYVPSTNLNILKLDKEGYFVVETVFDLDNDELTYYVIKDTTVTKHLSQLTFKHLLV